MLVYEYTLIFLKARCKMFHLVINIEHLNHQEDTVLGSARETKDDHLLAFNAYSWESSCGGWAVEMCR
jgi:hypothetical protein